MRTTELYHAAPSTKFYLVLTPRSKLSINIDTSAIVHRPKVILTSPIPETTMNLTIHKYIYATISTWVTLNILKYPSSHSHLDHNLQGTKAFNFIT